MRSLFAFCLFKGHPDQGFVGRGRHLPLNRGFERFFGAERSVLFGKTAADINPPELAQLYQAQDRKLLSAGGTQHYASQENNAAG